MSKRGGEDIEELAGAVHVPQVAILAFAAEHQIDLENVPSISWGRISA